MTLRIREWFWVVLATGYVAGTMALADGPAPGGKKHTDGPDLAPGVPTNFIEPAWRFDVKPGDQKAALVLVRMQGGQCTGTITDPLPPDGKELVLCAAHCAKLNERVNLRLSDGRVVSGTVAARDQRADLIWIRTDKTGINPPMRVKLSKSTPARGVKVWHAGFGIDKPGNIERGQVIGGPDANGQVQYYISVSPGDSGGGFFRDDNGELVGAVCCTTRLSKPGYVWAGGPLRAWQLKPGTKAADFVEHRGAVGAHPSRPTLAIHPTLHICDCD